MIKFTTFYTNSARCSAVILTVVACAIVVFSFFSDKFYFSEVLSHLRMAFIVVLSCAIFLLLLIGQRLAAIACTLAFALNAIPVLALYLPPATRSAEKSSELTIVS